MFLSVCDNHKKKAFVPYQESVLTKILRDSLGGNWYHIYM